MEKNESIKLAKIEVGMNNLSKWSDAHDELDTQRFDRTFNYVKERFDKIDEKLDTLWDTKNKQDGAFGMGKWIAGGVGGMVVAIIDFLINQHGGGRT